LKLAFAVFQEKPGKTAFFKDAVSEFYILRQLVDIKQ
jgi:hypothetical protein